MSDEAAQFRRREVGAWLTGQMERRDLSVRQLAEAMGVTSKTVYDWREERTAISEDRIPRLAEVLGLTEMQVRKGLRFWVPDESEPQPARDAGELDAVEALLEQALAELNRLKRERDKPA